jgi:hypothetical protein
VRHVVADPYLEAEKHALFASFAHLFVRDYRRRQTLSLCSSILANHRIRPRHANLATTAAIDTTSRLRVVVDKL